MDNNLETKNDYFSKKQEKEEIARGEKQKKMAKMGLWMLGLLAVVTLVIWEGYGYFNKAADRALKPSPGQFFEAQSRDHITSGQTHPAYNSNPPTGGWHYAAPAQTGIYDKEFPDEQLVHNLEHSHVWIAYKPGLAADQIEKLAEIAKDYGSKIIMTMRTANDTDIVLVAWEHLLKMDSVDESQVREFIEAYRGIAGPEKIPDAGFKDFRK